MLSDITDSWLAAERWSGAQLKCCHDLWWFEGIQVLKSIRHLIWKASNFIIIIFYFEIVTFFRAKLGSDVCPRVDNQTSRDTLQDLTRPLVEESPSASYPPMGKGSKGHFSRAGAIDVTPSCNDVSVKRPDPGWWCKQGTQDLHMHQYVAMCEMNHLD